MERINKIAHILHRKLATNKKHMYVDHGDIIEIIFEYRPENIHKINYISYKLPSNLKLNNY